MPLYVVVFTEDGEYRCQCRIRVASVADHINLAVKKIWGVAAFWAWTPGSDIEGRVYEQLGEEDGSIPRTGPTTVQILPTHRRPHVS